MTDSTAVARNTGGNGSGTGRQLLDHANLHAAVRAALQHDVVHEAAHEKDAAAARLQDVFGSQRIGHFVGLEPLPLIDDAYDKLVRLGEGRHHELHRDDLAVILAVAVLDGIDDRLADGNANPVHRVVVEAGQLTDSIADDLYKIHHLEVAVDLKSNGAAAFHHSGSSCLRP